MKHLFKINTWRQRTTKTTQKTSDLLKRPVVVVSYSLYQVHLGTRNTADRAVPVVSDPHVQIPGVKVFKILIEGDKILQKESEKVQTISNIILTFKLGAISEPDVKQHNMNTNSFQTSNIQNSNIKHVAIKVGRLDYFVLFGICPLNLSCM